MINDDDPDAFADEISFACRWKPTVLPGELPPTRNVGGGASGYIPLSWPVGTPPVYEVNSLAVHLLLGPVDTTDRNYQRPGLLTMEDLEAEGWARTRGPDGRTILAKDDLRIFEVPVNESGVQPAGSNMEYWLSHCEDRPELIFRLVKEGVILTESNHLIDLVPYLS